MKTNFANFNEEGRRLPLSYPFSPITPGTVLAHARCVDTRERLIRALERLENDDIDKWRLKMYRIGLDTCGDVWDFVDNVSIGHAFAEIARPKRMVEVGVRRGFATAAVVTTVPDIEIHLVDTWEGSYSGRPNPGRALIERQLEVSGYCGQLHFYKGDSHVVLPKLFADYPDLNFDMVLVDGDHTLEGANQDLKHLFPRVGCGGILIFDDIANPGLPYLLHLWRKWIEKLGLNFRSAEYLDHGHGVGFAIKCYESELVNLEVGKKIPLRRFLSLFKRIMLHHE